MNFTIKTSIKSLLVLTTSTLLMFQPPLFAGVYKWIDEDGQVNYGERPESSNAEKVIIRSNETTKTGIAESADEQAGKDAGTPTEVQPEIFTEKKIPAKEKRRLCQQAQQDITAISSRGRMREINAKGEYVYLTEDQRQQRLSAAKKRKNKYCR